MMLICLQRKSSGTNLTFNVIIKFKHNTPNSGKFLEKIGYYKPITDKWSNKYIFINFDRLKF
jgi:ribosomal protein S16